MTVFLMLFVICFFIFGLAVAFVLFKLVQGYDELVDRIGVLETRTSITKAKASDMALAIKQHSQNIERIKKELRR